MKKIFILALIAILPQTGHASLQVDLNSATGTSCYSESESPRLIACGPASFYGDDFPYEKCPDDYADVVNFLFSSTCYLGTKDGYVYLCETPDYPDQICNYCSFDTFSPWEPIGSNRVRRHQLDYNKNPGSNWRCDMTASYTYYGCDAGYYTYNPSANAGLTCKPCPSFGTTTGLSELGNTSITGCYLPSGTYTDETGTFTVSGRCYYKQ